MPKSNKKKPRRPFKSGYITVVGKPNVGKSTISNWLLGEKLSIISPRPETTRDRILGVRTLKDAQLMLIDTPGIHKPAVLLSREMVKRATETLLEADVIIFVIDAKSGFGLEDHRIASMAKDSKKPVVAVINKVDLLRKELLLPLIDEISKDYSFEEFVPISAAKGYNMPALLNLIIKYLPEGDKCFPEDELTDKSEQFMVAEMIREQVLELTYQEVPHSVAVMIEEFTRKPRKVLYIRAAVIVERPSQRKIIIGERGAMLKKIGYASRMEIEGFSKRKVFLELWVKVIENWRKDERALKMLGYL